MLFLIFVPFDSFIPFSLPPPPSPTHLLALKYSAKTKNILNPLSLGKRTLSMNDVFYCIAYSIFVMSLMKSCPDLFVNCATTLSTPDTSANSLAVLPRLSFMSSLALLISSSCTASFPWWPSCTAACRAVCWPGDRWRANQGLVGMDERRMYR